MDHMHQHPHIKSTHTENWIQKKVCGRATSAVRIKSRSCLKTEWHRANPGSVFPDRYPGSASAAPGLGRVPPAPGKRCRSDARSPPGAGTGHRAPAPGTGTGHRHGPGTGHGTGTGHGPEHRHGPGTGHGTEHRHGPGPGHGPGTSTGHCTAVLQGDPKSPALGRLMVLTNVADSEHQSALALCRVL